MKRGQIVLAGFADALPIACGMLASVCAMPTAFGIGFSLPPLILFCAVSAILLSFWMHVPKYGFGFGAIYLAGVIMLMVFRLSKIGDGAVYLIDFVLRFLEHDVTILPDLTGLDALASQVADPTASVTLFLMMIAALTGILLAFSLIRSKMILLPAMIPLPLILLSLFYSDQQPALWTILLLTFYFGYSLLGYGLRKEDAPRLWLYSLTLAPAILAFCLVLLAAFPKSSFEPIPEETRHRIFTEGLGVKELLESNPGSGDNDPEEYDMRRQGDRPQSNRDVFRIVSSVGGDALLRTHSYGQYSNGAWEPVKPYSGAWRSMESLGSRAAETTAQLSIRGANGNDLIVPYAFTANGLDAEESCIRSNGRKNYSWSYHPTYALLPGEITDEEADYYARYAPEQYTMPDGPEKDALIQLVRSAGIEDGGDAYETATNVARFVSESAEYSLTPGKTPAGEDFVLYFLNERRRGYCIHFASATTAILQALGYPARFTIGYYVVLPPEADGTTEYVVGERASHAWAEIYLPGAGWVPVESTPVDDADYASAVRRSENEEPVGETVPTPEPPTSAPTLVPPTPAPSGEPEPGTTQKPVGTPASIEEEELISEPARSRAGLWWIAVPLVPLLWIGTGVLIRKRREASFRRPDIKRSIPEMAYYLNRLERFGLRKDPDAEEWALEAVFSDHSMKQEHRELLKRVHTAQQTLCSDRPVKRFLLKWIRFII